MTASRTADFYHGSTYEDLNRLIAKVAWNVCRSLRLDFQQHGEDLMSEGWLEVAKCSSRYQDRGFKFTTFVTTRVFWTLWGYGRKRALEGQHDEVTAEHGGWSDYDTDVEARELLEACDQVEDSHLVLMHSWLGMTNAEIEKATGERDVARRRTAAKAKLEQLCPS